MYRVRLTDTERNELKRRTRVPGVMPRTRDRLEMVRLSDAGGSIPQIAQHLQISAVRVRYWIKQFLDGGFQALPDQPHRGRPSRLTPELLTALSQELARQDRTWTASQLADWLATHHGVRLTADHLGRRLKQAGFSYKRTYQSVKPKQDPQQVAEKRAALQELEKGAMLAAWTSAM